jgi:hypothetical protein
MNLSTQFVLLYLFSIFVAFGMGMFFEAARRDAVARKDPKDHWEG